MTIVIVQSSTEYIPSGVAPNGEAQLCKFNVNIGDRISWGYSSAQADPGVTRVDFDLAIRDTTSLALLSNPNQLWATVNQSNNYTVAAAGNVGVYAQGGGAPAGSSHGNVFGFFVFLEPGGTNYCQYGTRLKAASQFVYYLTPALIDTWLVADGLPWLAPVFTALYFTTVNAGALCGAGPPPMPAINLDTLSDTLQTITQILYVIAWPNVCECVPGTPNPTPYPLPNPSQPTGWPTFPTFTCSNADICTTLLAVQKQIADLQLAVGQDLGLTTLIQRYRSAFAYVRGATHPGLTGASTFTISRLLGLQVQITGGTAGRRVSPGTPNYTYDLGWMSVETADGMLDEVRISRLSQIWLSRLTPLSTTFGYYLQPGVTADITELQAET